MKNMKQWRACRKAVCFGMQMGVLITAVVAWLVMPGMIACCRTLAEALISLGVLAGMAVCVGVTGWFSVEYDRETDRQWREYRRMMSRVRGMK